MKLQFLAAERGIKITPFSLCFMLKYVHLTGEIHQGGCFPSFGKQWTPNIRQRECLLLFSLSHGLSGSKIRLIPLTLLQECCGVQEFSKVLHKFPAEIYTGSISQDINEWVGIVYFQLSKRLWLSSPSGYYEVEGVFNPMRGKKSR